MFLKKYATYDNKDSHLTLFVNRFTFDKLTMKHQLSCFLTRCREFYNVNECYVFQQGFYSFS